MSEPSTVCIVVDIDRSSIDCDVNGEACTFCGEVPYLAAKAIRFAACIPGTSRQLFEDELYACCDCAEEIEQSCGEAAQ